MAKKSNVTKKPTKLSVVRANNKFKCEWTRADEDYANGQKFYYSVNGAKLSEDKTFDSTTKTKHNITLNFSEYYPVKKGKYLTSFKFGVKGNRKKYRKGGKVVDPDWSDMADYTFKIQKPNAPAKLSAKLDSEHPYTCSFSWECEDSSSDNRIFVDAIYQSILLKDCTYDVTKIPESLWKSSTRGWKTGTSSTGTSITEPDGTIFVGDYSYRRILRVMSRGVAGASDWKVLSHVYARPQKATDVSATIKNAPNGYIANISWRATSTKTHPIDETIVQYAKEVPISHITIPQEPTPEEGKKVKDFAKSKTSGALSAVGDVFKNDGVSFEIDGLLEDEKCLWVRVNNKHDTETTNGDWVLAKYGTLATPSNIAVTYDSTNHSAEVSADNESDVEDSFLVVRYRSTKTGKTADVGVILTAQGETSAIVTCPPEEDLSDIKFGVYAAVGVAEDISDDYSLYSIKPYSGRQLWTSDTEWYGGTIPLTPPNVSWTSSVNDGKGKIAVGWEYNWSSATGAEVSWSDDIDAWESTEEPDTFNVSRIRTPRLVITNLDAGQTWYVRVRQYREIGDTFTYGAYSETQEIDLSAAPAKPNLQPSSNVIAEDGEVTFYWGYTSNDGTAQTYAEVVQINSQGEDVQTLGYTDTAQHLSVKAEDAEWVAGEEYDVIVRLKSASDKLSESDPVRIAVVEKLVTAVTTQFVDESEVIEGETHSYKALKALPTTVNVTGAGSGGTTTVVIKRAEYCRVDRPDESVYDGYQDETIFISAMVGEGDVQITRDDLIGSLDDGEKYILVATSFDTNGQTDAVEVPFTVNWTHQPVTPIATAEMYKGITKITLAPSEDYEFPEGDAFDAGDTCDIYRLSADKPVLIYKGAQMGETYADPFPAIGSQGGHRIVYVTKNGDYNITNDDGGNEIAWLDLDEDDGDILDYDRAVINFGTDRVELYYNVDTSNTWEKDFTVTKYLGGSVEGDWNPAVVRTSNMNALTIPLTEQDVINAARRLADYAGLCHVRLLDGSSFSADVQVTENREHDNYGMLVGYELNITKVDAPTLDGMTFEEWSALYDRLVLPDGYEIELPDGYILAEDSTEE